MTAPRIRLGLTQRDLLRKLADRGKPYRDTTRRRAYAALVEHGMVVATPDGYKLTAAGRDAVERGRV